MLLPTLIAPEIFYYKEHIHFDIQLFHLMITSLGETLAVDNCDQLVVINS